MSQLEVIQARQRIAQLKQVKNRMGIYAGMVQFRSTETMERDRNNLVDTIMRSLEVLVQIEDTYLRDINQLKLF